MAKTRSSFSRSSRGFTRHPLTQAVALFMSSGGALAQILPDTLPTVVISEGSTPATASVGGFADQPLSRSPLNATVIDADAIEASGARRLSDLYRLDASVTDAYNAGGYYDYASVRGFVIDNTYNYRREGLPVSAETALPLDHLERVELLRGTSGIQAGTSAPGGLFNAVVKRPVEQALRQLRFDVNDSGNALLHLDLGGRTGTDGAAGYRLNLLGERLNSQVRGTGGTRSLMALALDSRLSRDSLLEGEFEVSRQSQPSVPGLSLLGDAMPPADPRLNINTQPWSQPVVFQNFSGSLRYTRVINRQWNWQAQLGTQRLKNDDRLAYPYGCYDAVAGVYYADRYCPNGDFDLYDYRSENERRHTHAAQWRIDGEFDTGALRHQLGAGVLFSRYKETGQPQADNNPAVGTGNLFTLPSFSPLPDYSDPYTNRNERSTEWFINDVIRWNDQWKTWLGLRHTRLDRGSVRTDGSRATQYSQHVTTPWLAATWQMDPVNMLYASWGQGVESEVAPGRPRYTNQGEPLPALKSRQWEIGMKSEDGTQRWQATLFSITRPATTDRLENGATSCSADASCTRVIDGHVRHIGLELGAARTYGAWTLGGSSTWIHAERRRATVDPGVNGEQPTNVPRWVLRTDLSQRLSSVPSLTLGAHLSHESRRSIVPDGSLQLPSWTRVDASLRHDTTIQGQAAHWTLAIDNLFDRRYFQESPYQYSHVYLFPAPARTLRLSFTTKF